MDPDIAGPTNPIYTFGHSSRSAEEFVSVLQAYAVTLVVDVRRFPGSRRHPHFAASALAEVLRDHGIGYRHVEALGGRRSSPAGHSPNAGWENHSFRAYADYALTDEFQRELDGLIRLAGTEVPVLVCAEALSWRCHRRIIADWLLVRGCEVVDIHGDRRADAHDLPGFARVSGGKLTYPG